jgi:hypothetical protein
VQSTQSIDNSGLVMGRCAPAKPSAPNGFFTR